MTVYLIPRLISRFDVSCCNNDWSVFIKSLFFLALIVVTLGNGQSETHLFIIYALKDIDKSYAPKIRTPQSNTVLMRIPLE